MTREESQEMGIGIEDIKNGTFNVVVVSNKESRICTCETTNKAEAVRISRLASTAIKEFIRLYNEENKNDT